MGKRPLLVLALCVGGCDDTDEAGPLPVRTVSVVELDVRSIPRKSELTGVVGLYREEQIGFEIGGRITTVLDKGFEVRGPTYDEEGVLLRRGDCIAAMEGTRYGSQVGALQARLDAARRDLQAADAQVTLGRQTLERQKKILAEGAYDQAVAGLAARRASVRAAQQQLDSAAEDLGDAVLYAPYSGRVTAAHVAEGAVVSPGQPIVTLTLMDPVQVRVEVSAAHERDIQTGNLAIVYATDPSDPGKTVPVNAIVYEKSAVADGKLRTFRIDLITRNARYHQHAEDPELAGLPTSNEYLPVVREFQGEAGPLYVPSDAILEESGKTYVLRLPGVSFHGRAARDAVGVHRPEKLEVRLGDRYSSVVTWSFRSVVDDGTLAECDFVIRNPQPGFVDGIVMGRPQWLFRPRDLVPVEFNLAAAPEGFYVPLDAVVMIGSSLHVFRVTDAVARAVGVSVHDTIDDHRRVVSDALQQGDSIVSAGAHFLSDGQPVVVGGAR